MNMSVRKRYILMNKRFTSSIFVGVVAITLPLHSLMLSRNRSQVQSLHEEFCFCSTPSVVLQSFLIQIARKRILQRAIRSVYLSNSPLCVGSKPSPNAVKLLWICFLYEIVDSWNFEFDPEPSYQ